MKLMCALWSDWHVGEIISKTETGCNEFNLQIAKKRIHQLVEKTIPLVSAAKPAKLYILGLGDYISGNIHEELSEGTMTVLEQTEFTAGLIAEAFGKMVDACPCPVTFHGLTTDNHGRLTEKTRYKKQYATNMSYLSLNLARLSLQPNLRKHFHLIIPIYHVMQLKDQTRILLTHGHSSRCSLVSLTNYIHKRLAIHYSLTNKGFDFLFMGHFHRPTFVNNIVVNGSLRGVSEYDLANGYYSQPSQVLITLEKRKIRDFSIIYLD